MTKTGLAVLAALSMGLMAQNLSAAELKVAFVDSIRVAESSPQYEEARNKLEQEFSKRNKDLQAEQKQLEKLEAKLRKDATAMSDTESQRLERDILSRRRQLKNAQNEFREDFTLRQNEELHKLRRAVSEVVKEVAKENSIDLVMSDGVAYFSKKVDISDLVIAKLKESRR